jgi:hypothetical protein
MLLYRLAQNSAAQLLFLIDMTVEGASLSAVCTLQEGVKFLLQDALSRDMAAMYHPHAP